MRLVRQNTVITFASSGYVDLLQLWVAQSVPNAAVVPIIVCLDRATEEIARTLPGLQIYGGENLDFDPSDRQLFWINRLLTIIQLGRGADLTIHSDLDAFWLTPVIPLLEPEPFDFAFSIDFALPNEIKEKWGFILCCGFFAYRPGGAADAFLDRWLQEAKRYFDDQISVNRLLDSLDVKWNDHVFQGQVCKKAEVLVDGYRVRFVALPWAMFVRRHPMSETADAVMAHPFWERRFHRSFVQSYGLVRKITGTLPPLDLPPYPGNSHWRDYDWKFLHVLNWIANRAVISTEQKHHLGVLSTRFGDPARAIKLFAEIAPERAADTYFMMDFAEANWANGDRKSAARSLQEAIAATQDLTLLKKIAALARSWRITGLYLRTVVRIVIVTIESGRVRLVLTRKVRNGLVTLRRRA